MNVRLLRKRNAPPPPLWWRIIRIVVGGILVGLGIVMLVTPGQGILTILLGLWAMSGDVRLARRALFRIRILARRARRRYRAFRERRQAGEGSTEGSRKDEESKPEETRRGASGGRR